MSTRKSIRALTNTGEEFNVEGKPIKGSSYYGYTDGVTTCQVTYHNLTGAFGMMGTLALEPTEEDWFWITLEESESTCPWIEYPRDPLNPTGAPSQNDSIGDSGTEAFTFLGNFTYLKAILTRDYIAPPPMPNGEGFYNLGQIDKVLISL